MEVKLENSSKEQVIDKNSQQSLTNFWESCPQKTKTEIVEILVDKLGQPKNELDNNCLDAIAKKITYFYGESKDTRSKAISSIIGQVSEITQTEFKTGKRCGKIHYLLRLTNKMILRAIKEDLPIEKWTQIEQLAILDQNLLFKYRNSIYGKDICDFCPVGSDPVSQSEPQQPQNERGAGTPDPDGKNQVN